MTEEITEAIRNAFNEYLNAVDKIILENQALQIELQRLKQENEELKTSNRNLKLQIETYQRPEVVKVLTDWRTGELQLQEKRENNYRSALEEIKQLCTKDVQFENFVKIQKIILEITNE